MLRGLLWQQGLEVGRRHIKTLMKRMGIEAIYRKPNTSKPAPGHRIYPYLLRGLTITRPNQVWAMDITYIPMARGFVYLAAVVDWFSRRVLACNCRSRWRLPSVSRRWKRLFPRMKSRRYSTPTREASSPAGLHRRLKEEGIRISMDGKGRWRDNVFVERVWKSIKYEEVYLHAYKTVHEARTSDRSLHGVLQHHPAAFQLERVHARSGLLQPPARIHGSLSKSSEHGCRYAAACWVSFSRRGEIYQSDVERKGRERQSCSLPALIGVDESPAGYSLAGCSPAVPASASPTGFRMR